MSTIGDGEKLTDDSAAGGVDHPSVLGSEQAEKSSAFPATRWTLVQRTLNNETRDAAIAELCAIYWPAVYLFVRGRGNSPEDAEDLTQGFFAQMLRHEQLQRAAKNPDGGRLRSYLLTSVQNYLRSEHRKETAQKRGGGTLPVDIDIDATQLEAMLQSPSHVGRSPEEWFDMRWAEGVLQQAMIRLENEYRANERLALFDGLRPTLGQSADEVDFPEVSASLAMTENAVRVAAFRLRKQFRAILHGMIRESLTSQDDFDEELAYFTGLIAGS